MPLLCEVLWDATFFLLDSSDQFYYTIFMQKNSTSWVFYSEKKGWLSYHSEFWLVEKSDREGTFSLSVTCSIHPPAAMEGQAKIFLQQ